MSVHVHCPLVPPPSVSLSPPPTGVFTGQSVVLSCTIVLDSSVDTSVTVAVEWSNPASTIIASTIATLQSPPLTYQTTTTLNVFMAGDTGTYSCAAVVTPSRPLTTPSESVSASAVVSLSKFIPSHYLYQSVHCSLLQLLSPLTLSLLSLLEPLLYHSHGLSLRVTLFPTT